MPHLSKKGVQKPGKIDPVLQNKGVIQIVWLSTATLFVSVQCTHQLKNALFDKEINSV